MEAAVKIRETQHKELQASSCRSLPLRSKPCFRHTSRHETPLFPPHNKKMPSNNPPHEAGRVYFPSLSCFGLTHAPASMWVFVLKNCLVGNFRGTCSGQYHHRKVRRTAATAFNERFGAMAGVARWKVLPNSKLSGSWQV